MLYICLFNDTLLADLAIERWRTSHLKTTKGLTVGSFKVLSKLMFENKIKNTDSCSRHN